MKTKQLEAMLDVSDGFNENIVAKNPPPELYNILSALMKEKKVTRAELIRRLNVDRNYGYQLLNGTRIPTRENIIRIALLLRLTVDQLQQLLRAAGKSALYVRDIPDAKAYYALTHDMEYDDALLFIWGSED